MCDANLTCRTGQLAVLAFSASISLIFSKSFIVLHALGCRSVSAAKEDLYLLLLKNFGLRSSLSVVHLFNTSAGSSLLEWSRRKCLAAYVFEL